MRWVGDACRSDSNFPVGKNFTPVQPAEEFGKRGNHLSLSPRGCTLLGVQSTPRGKRDCPAFISKAPEGTIWGD